MLGRRSLEALSPLLDGEVASETGEWSIFCPYHGDSRRSASINIETGLWYCHGCGESGTAKELINDKENWVIEDRRTYTSRKASGRKESRQFDLSEAEVEGWHSALLSNKPALKEFMRRRGLTLKTIKKYQIGWDSGYSAYTLPIRDGHGEILNIRFYRFEEDDGRRKIWSVAGRGEPQLFPIDQIENGTIVICEGEWDALATIQAGIPAITRTGTADSWNPAWNTMFQGKKVFLCHDMDEKGQTANRKIATMLDGTAKSIRIVTLPYEVTPKHGKDLTDFWLEGHVRADFVELVVGSQKVTTKEERYTSEEEVTTINVGVMDSFDARLVGRQLRLPVTITGKRIPSYISPAEYSVTCGVDAGKKCDRCALKSQINPGEFHGKVEPYDPVILGLVNVTDKKVQEIILESQHIVSKCPLYKFDVTKHRTVEEIYVRPSVELDRNSDKEQDFTHRKVISSVSHDLLSNQTVDLYGTITPNPTNQTNEFLAWKVIKPKSMMDGFEITPELMERLSIFQDEGDPLVKILDIAKDSAEHVTRIFHRDLMHVFMDLVFHSPLEIQFGNEKPQKGWLDAVIVGDTRTGKSEAAARLIDDYGVGEMISCESSSYAGVVGGLDKTPDGKWIVKWGSIPVNDRRVVVLDEVSGLLPEQIAQMSAIRSSGIAEMTKIQTERAHARTRLLWLANPRNAKMDDYTFGVQALRPLIGNNEDIARFDMAMGVFSGEVPPDKINRVRETRRTRRRYDKDARRDCLRWAWTRKTDDIVFGPDVQQHILEVSNRMGQVYIEDPPLVQGANIRLKLARISAAIALRTFSTEDGEKCVVKVEHVNAAEAFLHKIYGNQNFGYRSVSDQRQGDIQDAEEKIDETMSYIVSNPDLVRFLKLTPSFNRQMLETVMNMSRDGISAMINHMWKNKMIYFDGEDIKLEPVVLKKVRDLRL